VPPYAPTPPVPPVIDSPALAEANRSLQAQLAEERAARQKLEQAQETESQRLQREAEEGRRLSAEGTAALREARTITSLAVLPDPLVGPKARAAMKLIEGLEYDGSGQPINLPDRLEAAKAAYGADLFTTTQPPLPGPGTQPVVLDLHQGVRPQANLTEEDAHAAYMRTYFPNALAPANGAA